MNLYDFEWRQYDPLTARTTTMDPHADRYPLLSPYSWAANNPISIIDPDGQDIVNTAFGTTYTGADAQNMFRQLQARSSSSSGNDPDKPKFYSFNSRTQARREQMAKEEEEAQKKPSKKDGLNSFERTLVAINEWNPVANAWDALSGYFTGEDRFGDPITTTEATFKAASVLPIGKIGVGLGLVWSGTTKVSKGMMAWKILGNASKGTLVSTALAGKLLHNTIGNPTVSRMTFGLMKRWPTVLGPSAPSLGTFIGRNTAGGGAVLIGSGIYDFLKDSNANSND